jgi:hypothetical protein
MRFPVKTIVICIIGCLILSSLIGVTLSSAPESDSDRGSREYTNIWVLSSDNILINATDAVNVSIETNIEIMFNDEINISTVDGNITLKEQLSGIEVNGSFSYENIGIYKNTSVTFTPDEYLSKATTYDFAISAFVKNVTGYSYFSTVYIISFTTEPYQNGTISGYILDSLNGTGVSGVNVSAYKSTFSKWTFSGSGGYYEISLPHNDNYTIEANGNDVHYGISSVVGINVTELVTIKNVNITLEELPQNVEVEVRSRIDESVWHNADGATDVLLSTNIKIGFLEPMNFDSAEENITLMIGEDEVSGNLTSVDNTTFYFDPTLDLSPASNYTMGIGFGIIPLNTSHEPPLWRDLTFVFTTRSDPIYSITPESGTTKIPIDTVITVTFNYEINETTLEGGISVVDENRDSVDGSLTYDDTTLTATFTPDNDLEGSTEYTVYLADVIMDMDGMTIFPPDDFPDMYEWSFTTKSTQGLLNITVIDKDLSPLFGVTLTITQNGVEIDTQYTTSTGLRSFQLDAGTYNVTASMNGYQIVTKSNVVITAGGKTPLSITLISETGTLIGTIKDNEGVPVADINVVLKEDSAIIGTDITDSNGAYEISNVYPGTYNISASMEGYEDVTIENVMVYADQITTESFSIEKSAPPPEDDDEDDEIDDFWIYIVIIIIIIIIIVIIFAVATRKEPEVEEEEEEDRGYGAPVAKPATYERPAPSTYRELEERTSMPEPESGVHQYYGRCPDCNHLLIGSPECFHCAVRATYEVQEPPSIGYYE